MKAHNIQIQTDLKFAFGRIVSQAKNLTRFIQT